MNRLLEDARKLEAERQEELRIAKPSMLAQVVKL